MATVPLKGGVMTRKVDGSRVVPNKKGSSLAKDLMVTGWPCNVLAKSELAIGAFSEDDGSTALITSEDSGQDSVWPTGHTVISY